MFLFLVIFMYMYLYTERDIKVYAYLHTYMTAYLHRYINTYIHTRTYAYAHPYVHTCSNFCSVRSVCKHIERVYLEAQQRLYAHQESLSESSVAVQIQGGCISAIAQRL